MRWWVAGLCLLVTVGLPATFPPDGGPTAFDRAVAGWVHGTFHPVARMFLLPSQLVVLVPVLLLGSAYFAVRGRGAGFGARIATLLLTPVLALLSTEFVLKPAFGRRLTSPYVSHPFLDYPSGNTVALTSVTVAFVLLVRTAWARALVLVVGTACLLGVAAGLVWYQYHYPTDVIGGICWSVTVGIAVDGACRTGHRMRGAPVMTR
jgi:membrane-associated phospholipid phosphatase